MRTHDVSAQPKTGEALLQLVVDDIRWSQEALTSQANAMAYCYSLLGISNQSYRQ